MSRFRATSFLPLTLALKEGTKDAKNTKKNLDPDEYDFFFVTFASFVPSSCSAGVQQ